MVGLLKRMVWKRQIRKGCYQQSRTGDPDDTDNQGGEIKKIKKLMAELDTDDLKDPRTGGHAGGVDERIGGGGARVTV